MWAVADRTQKEYIEAECRKRGITNLTIITADINEFQPPKPGSYDRLVSIEMFEHMKNYQARSHRTHTKAHATPRARSRLSGVQRKTPTPLRRRRHEGNATAETAARRQPLSVFRRAVGMYWN